MAKVVGAAPFVEPKRRSHPLLKTARIRKNTLPPDEREKISTPPADHSFVVAHKLGIWLVSQRPGAVAGALSGLFESAQ